MEFDEQAAIAYIRTKLSPDSAQRIGDDEILNAIDVIWDYYEDKGLLDLDLNDDDDDDFDEVDVDELIAHVKKVIAKDKRSPLTPADVEAIVLGEIEYEDTLEDE